MSFPAFNNRKATDVAAFFISKTLAKRISKLKLIKLMYIAERESIKVCGEPITYDDFFSLKKGPILSITLNKIDEPHPDRYWNTYIHRINNKTVELLHESNFGYLNDEEIDILEQVQKEHGHKSIGELIEYTHSLPEYKKPKGIHKRIPIFYEDIMKGVDIPDNEIEQLKKFYSEAAEI